MSGVYTCSLVFKPTTEQDEKSYLIKYIIYAYADPKFHYEFTARYHAAPCNSGYNTPFEKKLLQILSKLVVELACEIAILKSECHHVKMQRAGLQNVIFFTFTVTLRLGRLLLIFVDQVLDSMESRFIVAFQNTFRCRQHTWTCRWI
uniref:Uncharacterized protein n=1 Tax=Sphaerodactylus townsendi TaxID=933632 RepID=A0ACB8FU36_9SAUR